MFMQVGSVPLNSDLQFNHFVFASLGRIILGPEKQEKELDEEIMKTFIISPLPVILSG
jgi:hypothetical protein